MRRIGLFEFQLPSIVNQTFPNEDFEVIIIDDCIVNRESEINTFTVKHDLNIKWMRSKESYYRANRPIGCSRNTGLIHATGELIVFFDDYTWIAPEYLNSVWNIYNSNRTKSHIGSQSTIDFVNPPFKDHFMDYPFTSIEHRKVSSPCPGGWFFTHNASAPLKKIIEANGFWELADLTREEDVLMGLMLQEKLGWSFSFVDSPETTVYHMNHDGIEPEPPYKYKYISYKDLEWKDESGTGDGGINGLQTPSDTIQLVTKDLFNTKFWGSWGLIEYFRRDNNFRFNQEIKFNLAEERIKIGLD